MSSLHQSRRQIFRPEFIKGIFLFTLSFILAACGGGGGGGGIGGGGGGSIAGGIGGTGSVAAIASVTLNGVKFSCVGAVVSDDDGTIDQGTGDQCVEAQRVGRLSVGSVVTVKGTGAKDANGNPIASTVNISKSVFGPATNIDVAGQSFKVLNQTILIDQNTVFKGAPGLGSLAANTTVEVSGFRTTPTATLANGAILATLVEVKSAVSGESELKGIAVVTGGAVTINGVNINLGSQTAPTNGACVEAKGNFSGSTLTLTQALRADDDCTGGSPLSGSLDNAEVEGVITNFASLASFRVGDQSVNASSAQILGGTTADLLNGVKVEAEGSLVNGILIATKIQIKSNGVRLQGVVDSVSGASFNVLGITINTVTGTENSFGTVTPGSRVRVEGSKSGDKQINATKISNPSGGGTRTELRGPLDANPVAPNFSILGVTVETSGSTVFNSGATNSATFFSNTKKDQIVKARGAENTDNVITADEVENEN